MSIYDPPTEITPIFNPNFWITSDVALTKNEADDLYLSIFGGQVVPLTESFAGGIETNTIEPYGTSSEVLTFTTTGQTEFSGSINVPSGSEYLIDGVPVGGDALPDQTGNAGKFLTTDGTNPSWDDVPDEIPSQTGQSGKYLTTDGTTLSWDGLPINPIVDEGSPTINIGLNEDTFISSNLNTFYHRRYPTYDIRSNPTFSGTVIPVGSTRTYTTIASALAVAVNGDILELDQETFVIASTVTINKQVEIRGTKATTILSGNLSVAVLSITASGVYIHDITVTNPNTSSNAICIANSSADCYVDNVIIDTNEFGFTSSAGQFKVSNCTFTFVGTPDSHRYIYTTGASGEIIVLDNTFQAVNLSGTPVTRFMVMTAGTYSGLTKIIISGNSESSGTVLSQFFLQDSLINGTLPIQFFFDNNSASLVNSGILIFFASNCLNEYEFIAFDNNNFGGNSSGSGTTGIVKLDLPSAGTLGSTVFVQKDNVYTGGITHPNYLTASTGSDLIAYNFTVLSFPDITLYDSIWHELFDVATQQELDSLIPSQTGESGKYLTTDGTTLSWGTVSTSPAGTDTQVQFNDGGAFGADSGLVYNKTTDVLTTTGGYNTISGTYSVNGTPLVASQSGQSGKYLSTDGTSTSWQTVTSGGTPGGSDTQIQFNDGGAFGGDADLTFNKNTNTMTMNNGIISIPSGTNSISLSNGTISLTGSSSITSTTSLLMHFDVSPLVDSGFNNITPWSTNGTISISSAQARFGTASTLFATNSWWQATTSLTNNYEMTIECWIYATATPVGDCSIIQSSTSTSAGFAFGVANNGGNVRIRSWTAGPSDRNWDFSTTWASILNTWVHISWNRSTSIPSNQHYVTLNGVKSTNNATNQGQAITWTPIRIGRGTIYTGDFVGYVDELRLSIGTCRYTTVPFTPPTSAFGDLTTGGMSFTGNLYQNGVQFPNSVNVTASSTNASFYPVMTSATSGYQQCFTDGDMTYNPSTNTHTVSNLTVNNTLIVDTNTIRVDPTNNRVGIATTTPNVTLEVTGIIRNNNNASQLAYYNTGRYVEINADSTNTAYIDFHSLDAGTNDYDSRILSLGGLAGTSGRGTMVIDCNDLQTTASTTTYNTRVQTPVRTFAVQHLVWSGTVNASGGSVSIGLTKAYRGRYLISCANTNGGWNYLEAFVFGYTSDTKTTHQALYINGGSNPNISIGEEVGGSGFVIGIVNNTADLAYYHILSWIGGFGS